MTYRVYFNRGDAESWPQCWSVDEGDQSSEINVIGIDVGICPWRTNLLPSPASAGSNPKNTPSAWIEVTGRLEVRGGRAYFSPLL
jgi:hypothetical protein